MWPEVIASLRRAGIRAMDIYMLGRRLVMIVETDGRDLREVFATHVAARRPGRRVGSADEIDATAATRRVAG